MLIWKRNLWVLWIGVFFVSASFSMVIPFLPIFLLQIGVHDHTEVWAGLLFSAAFFAGAIASPFWGRVADKYGRKPLLIRAGFALFLVYTLTAFVTNPYQLLGLRIMQGLLSGFIPGSIALVGTNTPSNKVGYALSMISSASASGVLLDRSWAGDCFVSRESRGIWKCWNVLAHFDPTRNIFRNGGKFHS